MNFKVKDLINAGLFSILTLAVYFCAGMLGFMPMLMPIVPFTCALLSAPVFMLYSTKIKKFGMILIMGIIFAVVFSASGHGYYLLPGALILSLIGEFILKKGDYSSKKSSRLAYTVFSLMGGLNMLPLYIARDTYAKQIVERGYGQEYVDGLLKALPTWSLTPIVLLGCVGGFIGCTVGMKMLDKHFKKAGMI